MTDEELDQVKRIVADAVAEALASREPKRKSKAGLLTLEEAAELIRTPAATIRYWIWQGKLKAYKPGRAVLVREAELLALVEGNESTKKRAAVARSKRES